MSMDFKKARDFIYANGVLWERNLFAYLFQNGDLKQLHHNLKGYQNSDGGYGNAMEHDIRCPQSHPLALEFLLAVLAQTDVPPGDLLEGTAEWVERNRVPDGSLCKPPEVLDYPHAPWWNEGGQTMPDSIVGNLTKYGKATPAIRESTRRWVEQNLTIEKILDNDWLFMAYHAYDYFMNVDDFPEVEKFRAATIENIVELAKKAPEDQYYSLFRFAPTPNSPVAKTMPPELLQRCVEYIEQTQQEDGGWNDQHGLPQWRPYVTITNLLVLRSYGREIGV